MEIIAARAGDFVTLSIGAMRVTVLSDGILNVPVANFPPAETEAEAVRSIFGGTAEKIPVQVNAVLVQGRDGVALIDTGCGPAVGTEGRRLPDNLAAAGLSPDDIDTVLLTHMHIDHAGGLLVDGASAFPRARVLVAEAELGYWRQDGFPEQAPPKQARSAAVAAEVLSVYRERISSFAPGDEVVAGVTAVALPGHTPGHTGFLLASEGEELLVWGDIVHSAELQFARPDWYYGADVDIDVARRLRHEVLRRFAASGLPVCGMHVSWPGVGRIGAEGSAYRYLPIAAG